MNAHNLYTSTTIIITTMEKRITISNKEYKRLRGIEREEKELLKQLVKGLDDIKKGRVKPF